MQEDGTLTVKTEVDKSGIEEGLDDIVDEVGDAGTKSGNAFASSFGKTSSKIKNVLSKGFSKVGGVASGLLKTITSIIGVVGKLGLAFGVAGIVIGLVAGAIMVIVGALEKVFGENEQIKADLQYIIWAVQKALEPAVNFVADIIVKIVQLIIKAVQWMAVFIKMLTGHNIFANASAEDFAKSMEESNKNSKKTSKNLKEINKQLAGFDEMNILQDNASAGANQEESNIGAPSFDLSNIDDAEADIKKLGESWMKFGKEMKKALNQPLRNWFKAFGKWGLAVEGVTKMVSGLWSVITGLVEFVFGIGQIIVGLITGDEELIKQGVNNLVSGLLEIITGLYNFIAGIMDTIVGVIIGILGTIWDFIVWLTTQIGNIIGDRISDLINLVQNTWAIIKAVLGVVARWIYDNVIKPVADFFKGLWDGIKDSFKAVWDFIMSAFSKGGQIFNGLKDGIVNVFKTIVNTLISGINKIIKIPFDGINGLLNGIRDVDILGFKPFKGLWSYDPLPVPQIPKLAKGGIVNNPGPGVMMGSYIAGERGPEAVLPLTDETFDRLGIAIGKHTSINATIPIYVGNRQIARELRKIDAEDNFAFNR